MTKGDFVVQEPVSPGLSAQIPDYTLTASIGEKIEVLTAILNSRLARYKLFSYAPKTGTGDLIISVQAIEPFPVPLISKKQEEEIVEIFQSIRTKIEIDPYTDVSDMESRIDHLVYCLING